MRGSTRKKLPPTEWVLDDPALIAEWAETNYAAGFRHFSHKAVRDGLRAELEEMFPI